MPEPTPDAWRRVDRYLTETLVGHDPVLESAVADQNAAGLPAIEVAPVGGKFLHLLARIAGARRILEVGTLGGYSTIWLARALPADGQVVSIEAEPANARVARANLRRAQVDERNKNLLIKKDMLIDVDPAIAAAFHASTKTSGKSNSFLNSFLSFMFSPRSAARHRR